MAFRPPIRAVLFDAAGTLIHLREPVGETYARLARRFGVLLRAAALDSAFRTVLRSMPPMVPAGEQVVGAERAWWRSLVQQAIHMAEPAATFADFDAYFDALFAHYADAAAWSAAPGAHDLLHALRARGVRTGMVSNFDHRLRGILDGLALTPLLDVIVQPAEAGAAKPDARIFLCALRALAVEASAAVYVGDDAEHDIRGAGAAGMLAIDAGTLSSMLDVLERIDAAQRGATLLP